MKKDILVVLAGVAVLVFGSVWYFSGSVLGGFGGIASSTQWWGIQNSASASSAGTGTRVYGTGTISYLLGLKADLECTVSTSDPSTKRFGTLYITNAMVRGNFTDVASSTIPKYFMINDASDTYLWSTASTTGIKLSGEGDKSAVGINTENGIDSASSIQYDCGTWVADESVFVPPGNVVFTEIAKK